jgi:hypothetical protein
MTISTTAQALIKSIFTMTDAELQVLEGHFKTAYDTFLAAQPPVNGKPAVDTPLLRLAATASVDADIQAVYRAVLQRRSALTMQANAAAYQAKLAAAQVAPTVAAPIVTTLKTSLGL